jgi:hypothetical protein
MQVLWINDIDKAKCRYTRLMLYQPPEQLVKEVAEVVRLATRQRMLERAIDIKWEELMEAQIEVPIVSKYTIRKDFLRKLIMREYPDAMKYFDYFAGEAIQFKTLGRVNEQRIGYGVTARINKVLTDHFDEWW